jgi:TolA-binding protein
MSNSHGWMKGKGRKVINLLVEEEQHTDLKKLAIADKRSMATVIRELLRQGLDTRHGLSTRKVASRVDEHIERLEKQLAELSADVLELRGIVVRQQDQLGRMSMQSAESHQRLETLTTLITQRLPEGKKSWF